MEKLPLNTAHQFYLENKKAFDFIGRLLLEKDKELHGYFYTLINDIEKMVEKNYE